MAVEDQGRRDTLPAEVKRAVLVEAGHRCAIPTCRATTTEVAHIVPWATSHDHSFENLIALCPNCHTRYDQKGEIDRQSMRMYKQNLGILNGRYCDVERRLFELLAMSRKRVFVLGAGGDIMVANAVKDGLFEDKTVKGMEWQVKDELGVYDETFPLVFTYWVTDAGVAFIERYKSGQDVSVAPGPGQVTLSGLAPNAVVGPAP